MNERGLEGTSMLARFIQFFKTKGPLSGRQILVWSLFYIGLMFSGILCGRFTSDALQNARFALCALGILVIPGLFLFGPSTKLKIVAFCLLIPLTPLACLGGLMFGLGFDEYPEYVAKTVNIGDMKAKVVVNYDITYAEICRATTAVVLERPKMLNVFTERKTLVDIWPANSADIRLIDNGKKIEVTSPPLGNRGAIVRVFDARWNSPANDSRETILYNKGSSKPK